MTRRRSIPVTLAERPHPFPSRTRKLSSPAPKILRGQPFGKIGRRRDLLRFRGSTPPPVTGGRCRERGLSFPDDRTAGGSRAPAPARADHRGRWRTRRVAGRLHARHLPVPVGRRWELAEHRSHRRTPLHRGLSAGATHDREATPVVSRGRPRHMLDVRGRLGGSRAGPGACRRNDPSHASHDAGDHGARTVRPAHPADPTGSGPAGQAVLVILLAVAFTGIFFPPDAGPVSTDRPVVARPHRAQPPPRPSPPPRPRVRSSSRRHRSMRAPPRPSRSSRRRTRRLRPRRRRPPTPSSGAIRSAGSPPSTARPGRCWPS